MKDRQSDRTDECREYALRAARKAVMKGFDPSDAGAALAAAGLTLCYPEQVDFARACELWRHLNAYACELLMLEIIGKARADGVSAEELAALCERKQKRTEEFIASGGPALIGGAQARVDGGRV